MKEQYCIIALMTEDELFRTIGGDIALFDSKEEATAFAITEAIDYNYVAIVPYKQTVPQQRANSDIAAVLVITAENVTTAAKEIGIELDEYEALVHLDHIQNALNELCTTIVKDVLTNCQHTK